MLNEGETGSVRAWVTVAIFLVLGIVSFLDRAIIILMVEPIKHGLNLTDSQFGLLTGLAFAMFYAIAGLPIGWLIDRFSRRLVVFVGVTFWSLSAAYCGIAGSFVQLFAARMGVGAGEATLSPAAYATISEVLPRKRVSLGIALYGLGNSLGLGLALAIGGAIIGAMMNMGEVSLPIVGVREPWEMAFIVIGLPGVLLAGLIFLTPRQQRKSKVARESGSMAEFFAFMGGQKRYFITYLLGSGLLCTLGAALSVWSIAYLGRTFGMPVHQVGATVGGMMIAAGLVGHPVSGWLVDRWQAAGLRNAHQRYAVVAALVMATAGCVAFSSTSLAVCLPALGVVLLCITTVGILPAHLQLATPVRFRGRVSSVYQFTYSILGLGIGPSVVAAFTDFVFHDPQKLGLSLICTCLALGPGSAVLTALSLRAASRAVEANERASAVATA